MESTLAAAAAAVPAAVTAPAAPAAPVTEEGTVAVALTWDTGALYKHVSKRLLKNTMMKALVKQVNMLTRDVDDTFNSVSEERAAENVQ